MEKLERRPTFVASRRRIRTHAEWKVDTHIVSAAGPTRPATRSRISPAALFVKVIARTCPGRTPRAASRYAIRCVSTRVLPEPAPAMISSADPSCSTAARCCSLRPSSRAAASGRGRDVRAGTWGAGRSGTPAAPDPGRPGRGRSSNSRLIVPPGYVGTPTDRGHRARSPLPRMPTALPPDADSAPPPADVGGTAREDGAAGEPSAVVRDVDGDPAVLAGAR